MEPPNYRAEFLPVGPLVEAALDNVDRGPSKAGALSTGLIELDRLHVVRRGEVTIVHGAVGAGGRCLALNFAAHVALREQKAAAIFAPVVGPSRALLEILAAESAVECSHLEDRKLSPEELEALIVPAERLLAAPMYMAPSDTQLPALPGMMLDLCRRDPSLALVVAHAHDRVTSDVAFALRHAAAEASVAVVLVMQGSDGADFGGWTLRTGPMDTDPDTCQIEVRRGEHRQHLVHLRFRRNICRFENA